MYDLDSELPFPTYFHKYVTETFRTDAILNPEYHRKGRQGNSRRGKDKDL